jgi:hypothetical protein
VLAAHVRAALPRQPVELRLAATLGHLPFGREDLAILQPVQRRIERPLRHLDDIARDLLEPLRDRVAVQRTQREDFQNQEVERALGKVGFRDAIDTSDFGI